MSCSRADLSCVAGEQGGDGHLDRPYGVRRELGRLMDVVLVVGDPDTGDGHACGLGQVSQPVGARCDDLSCVSEQQAQLMVGLLFALPSVAQG